MFVESDGVTGRAYPHGLEWPGDAGLEIQTLLDAELSVGSDAFKQENFREDDPCVDPERGPRYCDSKELAASCCPVKSEFGTFTIRVWVEEGQHEARAGLQRMIDGELQTVCEGSITFDIRREKDDPRLQPFNILLSTEKGDLRGLAGGLATDHATWHETRDGREAFPGNDWLFFHYMLVKLYDDWREFYEYPRVETWDGSTPIPASENGYTLENLSRPVSPNLNCVYGGSDQSTGCRPPGWFTQAGDGAVRPDDNSPGNLPCRNPDGTMVGGGQTKLGDFSNSVALGCVVNRTHHAAMHAVIPGAMRWVKQSPFEPMFWRYHKWASGLRVNPATSPTLRASMGTQQAEAVPVGLWGYWEESMAEGPPGITSVWPPAGRSLAGVPGILVILWEPVTGFEAGDLTVNGSPATDVENKGEWYLFTGFDSPGEGAQLSTAVDVTVSIAPGAFEDLDGNPFAGDTWGYTIAPDTDGDFIPDERDNCPNVANRDQRNSDADLVHGYHAHPGMVPTFGSAGDEEGDACDIDDDNDLLSDALEELIGSDPTDALDPDACPTDVTKTEPGECGCGVSDADRNDDGVPECIAPLSTPTTTLPPATIECALPVSGGPTPTATDCLYILQAAIGLKECIPACACAPSGRMPAKATDALLCLRVAVGTGVDPLCPCPDLL